MIGYIISIISMITSLVVTCLAANLALKNMKQEKFFSERKKIYYELASILPDIEEFMAQSDYMDGTEGHCGAEDKILCMENQLKNAEKERQRLSDKTGVDEKRIYDIETQISNLKYKIAKHKEYLEQMKALKDKIDEFEKNGNKNLLRIFASEKVCESYVRFCVALHNEYYCDIGVKKEDITYHIIALISNMRQDLSGKSK